MEQVLYADILFFVNFSMDFVTLYLVSRLISIPFRGINSTAAAAIGGIFATVLTATGTEGIISLGGSCIISLVMVAITFGRAPISLLLKRGAVFWGSGALLGGIMTVICTIGGGGTIPHTGGGTAALLFLGSAVCLGMIKAFCRLRHRGAVFVSVTLGKRRIGFRALTDSGNLLTDPLSSRPVIIADRSVFGDSPLPDISGTNAAFRKRIRMIPVRGMGGTSLLPGFIPDKVTLETESGSRPLDAVIAVADLGPCHFGGYPANLPSALL